MTNLLISVVSFTRDILKFIHSFRYKIHFLKFFIVKKSLDAIGGVCAKANFHLPISCPPPAGRHPHHSLPYKHQKPKAVHPKPQGVHPSSADAIKPKSVYWNGEKKTFSPNFFSLMAYYNQFVIPKVYFCLYFYGSMKTSRFLMHIHTIFFFFF